MKTFLRTAASVLLGFLIASMAARAQQPQEAAPQAEQASPSASIPAYPNTAQGLEKFMKDMMKAAKNGDHDVLLLTQSHLCFPMQKAGSNPFSEKSTALDLQRYPTAFEARLN